jgi:hypothetical protein
VALLHVTLAQERAFWELAVKDIVFQHTVGSIGQSFIRADSFALGHTDTKRIYYKYIA